MGGRRAGLAWGAGRGAASAGQYRRRGAAGGGGGDRFVQFHVVFAREPILAEMCLGSFQSGFRGGGFQANVLNQSGERLMNNLQRKIEEGRRIARPVRSAQHFIVSGLMVFDERFDQRELEDRMATRQEQTMPKAPDPAVAVDKGMNELQFIVANRALAPVQCRGRHPALLFLCSPADFFVNWRNTKGGQTG